ncbi:MAG: Glu-tRNA(Gln) amidotransferase subunit GatD [Nitrososphaeria archaeon]
MFTKRLNQLLLYATRRILKDTSGYKGALKAFLEAHNIGAGDIVVVKTDKDEYKGTVIPRYEYASQDFLTLKLPNGYNIGVEFNKIRSIKLVEEHAPPAFAPQHLTAPKKGLPKAVIISTGGTIASRVDYRTGGVRPALSASDLLSVVPELGDIAQVDADLLFSIYSENMTFSHWSKLSERIYNYIKEGYNGVVVTHGTDTMGYAAAALSFALHKTPIPILLVGSQRSSDRPSSDAASNLIAAMVTSLKAPFSGVYVSMHEWVSDERISIHVGTKVRKLHTSRRDAFKSINTSPVAVYKDGELNVLRNDLPKRGVSDDFRIFPKFEEKVSLIKFYPGFDPSIIESLYQKGYKGLVLEGTGLGHVNKLTADSLKKLIRDGFIVCMTSQCIYGRVRLTVYDTGRDLLDAGVLPLEDMLPETAFVKLSWCLGNFEREEVSKMMRSNIANEYNSRLLLEEVE